MAPSQKPGLKAPAYHLGRTYRECLFPRRANARFYDGFRTTAPSWATRLVCRERLSLLTLSFLKEAGYSAAQSRSRTVTTAEHSNPSAVARALIKAIDDAFGATPYPGDDRIVDEHTGYDSKRAQIKSVLKRHHWHDVSFNMLDGLRDSLPLLSPEGFRFYLPAFMFFCVTDSNAPMCWPMA